MLLTNRHFGSTALFAACFSFAAAVQAQNWFEESCSSLHNRVFKSSEPVSQQLIQVAESRALRGELCAQNIVGRMYAEGSAVDVDWERAYLIFSNLSDRDYPPAQLNLAIHIADKPDLDLNPYLSFVVGLIAKYGSSSEYADIARGAKEVGLYVLRKKLSESTDGKDKYSSALKEFEYKAGEAQVSSAIEIVNKRRAAKERDDTIVGIIALGAAVSAARSRATPSYSATGSWVPAPAWSNYPGIVGPTGLYRAPAWRGYSGIIGPDILYKLR